MGGSRSDGVVVGSRSLLRGAPVEEAPRRRRFCLAAVPLLVVAVVAVVEGARRRVGFPLYGLLNGARSEESGGEGSFPPSASLRRDRGGKGGSFGGARGAYALSA